MEVDRADVASQSAPSKEWQRVPISVDLSDDCLVVMTADCALNHLQREASSAKNQELSAALNQAGLVFFASNGASVSKARLDGFAALTPRGTVLMLDTDWTTALLLVETLGLAIRQSAVDNPLYVDLCEGFHIAANGGACFFQVVTSSIQSQASTDSHLEVEDAIRRAASTANKKASAFGQIFAMVRTQFQPNSKQATDIRKKLRSALNIHESIYFLWAVGESERNAGDLMIMVLSQP